MADVKEKVPYFPGKVDFTGCLLYNYKGKSLDIKSIIGEVNIYYSMTEPGIRCEILLADTLGLIEKHPIVGDENILIGFKTPMLETNNSKKFKDTLYFVFRVTGIDKRAKVSEKSETYVVEGVSNEIIQNMRNATWRAYTDLTAKELVEEIYDTLLKPNNEDYVLIKDSSTFAGIKEKELDIQETKDDHSFVFTGQSPLTAINHIAFHAEEENGETKSNNFMFFETNQGWSFKTIDSLMKEEPKEDFFYGIVNVDDKSENREQGQKFGREQEINNIRVVKQMDAYSMLRDGGYFNTVQMIDPLTKNFQIDTFIYDRDKEDLGGMEDELNMITEKSLYKLEKVEDTLTEEDEASRRDFIISHVGDEYENGSLSSVSNDIQLRHPMKFHKYYKYGKASRILLDAIVFQIIVPGHSDLEIGDVIRVHLTQNDIKPFDGLNLLYGDKEKGAAFLVISMRHTINREKDHFFTTFECVRNGYYREPKELLK